ncbi:hypothetical protein [Flavobacterium limnophilum]|nr:hypothetical protein [Flavobacterium limnophilum]
MSNKHFVISTKEKTHNESNSREQQTLSNNREQQSRAIIVSNKH